MTSKRRAFLRSKAMNLDTIIHIGKSSLTPEITIAIDEALEARELIKINILKNCMDDIRSISELIAERTHSEIIQIIGRRIVIFRQAKEHSAYEE